MGLFSKDIKTFDDLSFTSFRMFTTLNSNS